MEYMFRNATLFNEDITTWDMGKVKKAEDMFYQAVAFNQDIGAWNVSSVTNFNNFFNGASSFNRDLSNWNTSSKVYETSATWYLSGMDGYTAHYPDDWYD